MKVHIAALLVSFLCVANAGEVVVAKTVNLNDQRELDKLAAEAPKLHAKIEDILASAGDQPPEEIGSWLKISFDADYATYEYIVKTSDPPKAELSFILGDTKYHARITLRNVRPTLVGPLRFEPDAAKR